MKNLYSDADAKAAIAHYMAKYAAKGCNEDLAIRTYTTRLLGGLGQWHGVLLLQLVQRLGGL